MLNPDQIIYSFAIFYILICILYHAPKEGKERGKNPTVIPCNIKHLFIIERVELDFFLVTLLLLSKLNIEKNAAEGNQCWYRLANSHKDHTSS